MAKAVQEHLEMPSCFGAFGAKAPGKPPAHGKVFPVSSHKHSFFRLSSSASAHDLRSLDMEATETTRECSPRTPLDDCSTDGESQADTPNASTSLAPVAPTASLAAFHWKGFLRLWKLRRLSTFPPFGMAKLSKRFTRSGRESRTSSSLLQDAHDYCSNHSLRNFTLAEICAATNNFSSDNIIGKGGYAQVYKGCLEDGRLVAIKRLMRGSMEQKIVDFLSELGIIVHINHPNAAKLVGYSVEGGMYLVLQLSPNGNLASRLHESNEKLEWNIRYKVALGTAKGLHYLHENCQRRIIHRDIKAANILLTEDFEPQICDFGLAKWLPDQWTHHTVSKFEGTFGYLAPEYFMHGIVDEKTDVFAFGVLLLELITGRRALDSAQHSLVMWAKPFLDSNDIRELVDPFLDGIHDTQQIQHVILAASLCVHHSPLLRPRMSQVVQILEGEANLESLKLSPRKVLHRTYSEELIDTDDYNLSRYLNDIKRHKQLALDS